MTLVSEVGLWSINGFYMAAACGQDFGQTGMHVKWTRRAEGHYKRQQAKVMETSLDEMDSQEMRVEMKICQRKDGSRYKSQPLKDRGWPIVDVGRNEGQP